MAKYHINKKGEPGPCSAQVSCPFGGESDHYDSKEDAQKAYEQQMTEQLIPDGQSKTKMTLTVLNRLAKVSSDLEVLEEAVERKNERILKSLSGNPNMTPELLAKAKLNTSKKDVRLALVKHPNFPVSEINPEEAVEISTDRSYKDNLKVVKSDDLNDAQFKALVDYNETRKAWDPSISVELMLSNPNNKLSVDTVIEHAEKSSYNLSNALRGKYPLDRVKDLPRKLIDLNHVSNTRNPEVLNAYSDWLIKNVDDPKDKEESDIAARIVLNDHSKPETINKLGNAGFAPLRIYKDSRTSPEVKERLAKSNKDVARRVKLDKLEEAHGKLRSYLTVDGSARKSTPYRDRGYHIYEGRLDVQKIKELNLDKEDIRMLMGHYSYNAGFSFDPETGYYRGETDSTD